jgi:RNA recognition motif-containing protein
MSIRLYVGNLPEELDRQALETIFHESGESVSLKVITDRKTGKCRGFGFVTVGSPELADTVIEKFNGFDFNGAVLKLEKALPRNKGKAEGEAEDGSDPDEATPNTEASVSAAPKAAPTPKTARRDNNKSQSRRSNQNRSSSASSAATTSEAHQPDPRWANELEKLKQQLLAAQAVT